MTDSADLTSLISSPAFLVGLVGMYVVFVKLVHRSLTIRHRIKQRYGSCITTVEEAIEPAVFDALEGGLVKIALTRGRLWPDWDPEALANMLGTYIRVDADLLRMLRKCRVIGRLEEVRNHICHVVRWHLPLVLMLAVLVLGAATAPVFGNFNLLAASDHFRRVYLLTVLLSLLALLIVEVMVARKGRYVNSLVSEV